MKTGVPRDARVGLVVASTQVSGTERRIGFLYPHLVRRFPGRYRLALSQEVATGLERAEFGLDSQPGVHVLADRSRFDRKRFPHSPWWTNTARSLTLARYRRELMRWVEREEIDVLQVYLELVPFLGMFPPGSTPVIPSVVTHIPGYYRRSTIACQLLLNAARRSIKVDCLYEWIAERLADLGTDANKLNWPYRNTVDHIRFHPLKKEPAVSFTARYVDWKGPLLMEAVIEQVLPRFPCTRFAVLGDGPLYGHMEKAVRERGWSGNVQVGFLENPERVVNKSLVHVSIEAFDNVTNQSLLEAMAAGCAVVATDVGRTGGVVTSEVGLLASPDPGDIAQKVMSLLSNPGRAIRLGASAREQILRDHHVDRYVDYLGGLHDFGDSRPIQGGRRADLGADGP